MGIYLWALPLMFVLGSLIVIRRSGSSVPSKATLDTVRTDVSLYRVCLMVITWLCILTVDFRVFPRRYAKTETYGTSLMDLGVGSFVLADAFVSRQARHPSTFNLLSALSTTSPLILIGFGRLVSTSGVDYQVHVGEYGVHWNFFFTLAAVAVLSSLINVPPQYCGILGSLILVGYQFSLNNGLNTYLLSSDIGSSIISQNKEDATIFSSKIGCLQISKERHGQEEKFGLLHFFWLLAILLNQHVERVSHRMCNLSYVTLVGAVNLQWLAILMLSDYVPGSSSPILEDAFNRNLLASFLVANVLTGLVNLSFDTLFASTTTALLILSAYLYLLSVIAGTLEFYGVRSKFW
ncbi:hypothetical protein MLD38_018324 [Melastoma candidum]|uniref:Uncharacterized protein n=1 Tax=Melastoma candidum TaxID=119954 RepID=A0ACB9QUS9_9MYRT|nr:hypothetical protein MLD38_018324 [Melastoma candidum]